MRTVVSYQSENQKIKSAEKIKMFILCNESLGLASLGVAWQQWKDPVSFYLPAQRYSIVLFIFPSGWKDSCCFSSNLVHVQGRKKQENVQVTNDINKGNILAKSSPWKDLFWNPGHVSFFLFHCPEVDYMS